MAGPPMKTRPCPPWLGVAATRSSATARSEAGADRFTFPSTAQRDDPLGTSAYHREARRAHRRAAGLLGTPMCSLEQAYLAVVGTRLRMEYPLPSARACSSVGRGTMHTLAHHAGASMKVAVESIEGCKRRLAVEAPADVVQQEWERAYGRVQRQARLPGFRKGHVPRSLVKVHFSDDVRREVAEHLIPDVYRRALSEAKLDPVNEPDLQEVRLEENAPLSFVAVVEVKPAIALADYRGVEVQHAPAAVSDDEAAAALEQMREQQAEFRAVDRAAASGDLAVVDDTLRPDEHDATTANGYHFVIGSGAVMPEIDAAAVGMKAGDQKDVALRFPDDHRLESLRGKGGTATLKVSEVKEKILPALDDEFAKSLGEFATLDALRAEVRKQLETRREAEQRRELEDKIVGAVLQHHEFTVPDALVMRQIAHQVEH